jgi:hypothetical protein
VQLATTLPKTRASIVVPTIFKRLGSKRVLLGGLALALIGVGLAWQWSWLVAIGVAPLLVGATPCVVMCALGLCIHRMCSSAGSAAPDGTSQNSSSRQES